MKNAALALIILALALLACSLTPIVSRIERTKDDAATVNMATPIHTLTATLPQVTATGPAPQWYGETERTDGVK